jgi:hypothetical protein
MSLVLHAIILHKPKFKSKEQSLLYALDHFPKEKIKGFVRETESSFRVRVVPKTKFIKTSYVSKVINPNMTIVLGKLKSIPI